MTTYWLEGRQISAASAFRWKQAGFITLVHSEEHGRDQEWYFEISANYRPQVAQ